MNCELVLSTSGGITAMCIDQSNGCVVVGIQEIIRYVFTLSVESLLGDFQGNELTSNCYVCGTRKS